MICCSCGKKVDINYGREYWNGIYCKKCADEMLSTPEYIKIYKRIIADLQAENAALRGRLENVVELSCKVGDSVYYIQNGKIYYGTVVCLCFDSSSVNKIGVELPSLGISEYMPSSLCIEKREVGKTLFFTIAEAKSRLAELKGGKE